MKFFKTILYGVTGLLAPLLLPSMASAHAFGQQYTLPLPISLYATGASIALIASFVILSFFSRPHAGAGRALERVYALPPWAPSRWTHVAARTFGLAVLAFAVAAGFFGSDVPVKNPALFLFWIGLLLVVAYVSAFLSGVWERIDPFRTLVELVLGRSYPPLLSRFPSWLKYVPPLLFFYFVLWFELLSYGAGSYPQNVAILLLGYVVLTYFGVALFGNDAWFRWGDFFSVFFNVIGRFAPALVEDGKIRVTPPGERLLTERPQEYGILIFILLILSSTAYDGIRETAPWVRFFSTHQFLTDYYASVSLLLLLAAPFVFLAFYAAAVYLMRLVVGGGYSTLMLRFVLSLVPIAVAYNVAHYFSLVVSEGQNVIPMLSDPFGRGWNLFGTADYIYNPGLISASAVWYIQVSVIVIGHIIATYIAHRIALLEFSKRSHVIVGQLPMLALMVLYTCVGLWILSLPYSV